MTGTILAIDLAKAKSLFCWYQASDQTQALKPVAATPSPALRNEGDVRAART